MIEGKECCVREMTVEEEIKALEISDGIKERIIRNVNKLYKENRSKDECLYNCYREIDRLNRAIVSQAKMIGSLEDEIRGNSISCDFGA